MGDAVMSTPALQRLRQARPSGPVTLLSPEKLAGLWQGSRFLTRCSPFLIRKALERHFSTA